MNKQLPKTISLEYVDSSQLEVHFMTPFECDWGELVLQATRHKGKQRSGKIPLFTHFLI